MPCCFDRCRRRMRKDLLIVGTCCANVRLDIGLVFLPRHISTGLAVPETWPAMASAKLDGVSLFRHHSPTVPWRWRYNSGAHTAILDDPALSCRLITGVV